MDLLTSFPKLLLTGLEARSVDEKSKDLKLLIPKHTHKQNVQSNDNISKYCNTNCCLQKNIQFKNCKSKKLEKTFKGIDIK
jgi:hypothetical protein